MGFLQSKPIILLNELDTVLHQKGDLSEYYKLEQFIGSSERGNIFKAQDIRTFMTRALKEFRRSAVDEDMLQNEIHVLKKLDHPNIIRMHEVIESPTAYYISTEYLEGQNLMQAILDKGNSFTLDQVKSFMFDILYALRYCHENNIVHCNICPEKFVFDSRNIQDSPRLKMIGFALAYEQVQYKKTKNKFLAHHGQIHFRAPEMFDRDYRKKDIKIFTDLAKVDVWSAGVVFYIILKGSPPFTGSRAVDIKEAINVDYIENLLKYEDEEKEIYLDLIRGMLEIDVNKRLTAKDLLNHRLFYRNIEKPEAKKIRSSLYRMSNFVIESNHSKITKKLFGLIVSHLLDTNKEKEVSFIFRNIDGDKDGYLSLNDLTEKCGKFPYNNISTSHDQILKNCDWDSNGTISYQEFLSTSINWEEYRNSKDITNSFLNFFDIIKKDSITLTELQNIITINSNDEDWISFMNEVDADGNGKIELSELQDYFYKVFK